MDMAGVVLLIGRGKFPSWLDQSEALPRSGGDTSLVISTIVPQTSFCRKTSGGVAKCCLFSQANCFFKHNNNFNNSCFATSDKAAMLDGNTTEFFLEEFTRK